MVFLFLIGELLEGVAASRARASILDLTKLVPKTARLGEDGQVREIQAETLSVGAMIQVRPGHRISPPTASSFPERVRSTRRRSMSAKSSVARWS